MPTISDLDTAVLSSQRSLDLCEEFIEIELSSGCINKFDVSLLCSRLMQKAFGKANYQDQWDKDNPR